MLKRLVKWVLLPVVLLVGVLVLVANLLSEPSDLRAEDFAALPITLPDGGSMPMGELVGLMQRGEADERLGRPLDPQESDQIDAGSVTYTDETGERVEQRITFTWPPPLDPNDPMSMGRWAYDNGRYEEAMALFSAVPEDHDQYGRAQRYLGWDLLTKTHDRPRAGLAHIHRALSADPLDGNHWQDAARIYLRAVGVRFDPVHGRWMDPPKTAGG